MLTKTTHIPVLFNESIEYLQAKKGGLFLDCTLGGGGHTTGILNANTANIVYAGDRDTNAIKRSAHIAEQYPDRFFAEKCAFSEIGLLFRGQKFNGIIADLGISSDHLEENRGFSFKDTGELDMRMDQSSSVTASDVVNGFSHGQLCSLFRRGGVRTGVKSIADAIVKHRPFHTAQELADAINQVVKTRPDKKLNPATVAFQAIRIEVNNELGEVKDLLDSVSSIAASGARLVIISFHSLEDKLVASTMRDWSRSDTTPALWANQKQEKKALGKLLTKKAVVAGADELELNSRARSAKLRCFEFLKGE